MFYWFLFVCISFVFCNAIIGLYLFMYELLVCSYLLIVLDYVSRGYYCFDMFLGHVLSCVLALSFGADKTRKSIPTKIPRIIKTCKHVSTHLPEKVYLGTDLCVIAGLGFAALVCCRLSVLWLIGRTRRRMGQANSIFICMYLSLCVYIYIYIYICI